MVKTAYQFENGWESVWFLKLMSNLVPTIVTTENSLIEYQKRDLRLKRGVTGHTVEEAMRVVHLL